MGCADSKTQSGGSKPLITVEYFGMGYGRADPIRFLLHHAKKDYQYIGYDFEQWGKIKGEGKGGEFAGLPRVNLDGKEYGQSMATLRMLGAKYGYYDPKDWRCAAKVDVFVDAWVDMHDKANNLALKMSMGGCTPEEAMTEIDGIIEKIFTPALVALEKQLTDDGGPFMGGSKISIGDCCWVANMANIMENPAGPWTAKFTPILADYPKIQAYHAKLRDAFKARLGDPNRKPFPF